MPQMMPINWLISFFFFLLIFLIFNIMNYYIFNKKMNYNNKFNIKFKNLIWKW
uniref:ATP synthase F0 subunit 8 n=1 Tax=Pseudeustrotia carneola TaxID=214330 RepID=UPI0023D82F52|nr:ATP synthase F0 subunit 8 [Pseudeustrotia carneola]WDD39374.1 ATP synthase F0 subunit 8 [Pseudeustrotia carneola]